MEVLMKNINNSLFGEAKNNLRKRKASRRQKLFAKIGIFISIFTLVVGVLAPLFANVDNAFAAGTTPMNTCTPEQLAKVRRWWFMLTAGLDFGASGTAANPTVLDNTAAVYDSSVTPPKRIVGGEGTTVISDVSGNLLFWTDGNTVWNRDREIMPNGSKLGGNPSAVQSTVAFPSMADPNKFFVISLVTGNSPGFDQSGDPYYTDHRLRWSVIDMTLDNGMGDVAADNHALPLGVDASYGTSEQLTAVPNATGDGFWVFTTDQKSKGILAWEFDANGPKSQTPVASAISLPNNANGM